MARKLRSEMHSEKDPFRPWRGLPPRTTTEMVVDSIGGLGALVLLGCIAWSGPDERNLPAILGCAAYGVLSVVALFPQLWSFPRASTYEGIVAQYERARWATTWMSTGIIWVFVVPALSSSEAPPGLRLALSALAILVVLTCLACGSKAMISVSSIHKTEPLDDSQRWRLSIFQSVSLHALPVLVLVCHKLASEGAQSAPTVESGSIEVELLEVKPLDLSPPNFQKETAEQGFSESIDQVESQPSDTLTEGMLDEAAVQLPNEQADGTVTEDYLQEGSGFVTNSLDFTEPVLAIDGSDEAPLFGAAQSFSREVSLSGEAPKGMLRGSLCFIPAGTRSLADVASCRPVGTLYARTLHVPRTNFRRGFPGISNRYEWFAIDYRGQFTVRTEGVYRFRLYSDDGARLYINGKHLINNDGIHQASNAFATVHLSSSTHSIRVHYFQGPQDEVALILSVTPPGGVERVWSAEL